MVLLSYIFVYIFCIFMLGKACEIESDDITCALQGRGPEITWFDDCFIS